MTTYSCHDRMCGADDCINCHPENFKSCAETNYHTQLDRDDYTDPRELDRLADAYERSRNL